MSIRLITVSGPRGAGKETIVQTLLKLIPGLYRIVPHTTRNPRPSEQDGREYHFVSNLGFQELIDQGAFVWYGDIGPTQRSGTIRSEFRMSSIGSVIDVLPSGARAMSERVRAEGGHAFLIGVFASSEERRARIRTRQSGVSEKEIERLICTDPVSPRPADYLDFDFLLRNEGISQEEAGRRAVRAVRIFLNRTA
ncbi:MAG: hypothetical protein AAB605_03200 [Patescibacteria group bacterium]